MLDAVRALEPLADITILPVSADGRLDVGALEAALRDDTALVSVMLANNEIGTAARRRPARRALS